MSTKHLDLGCGYKPRNPFDYEELYVVDIEKHPRLDPSIKFASANLALEKMPFDDNTFDSISAYDFIEHIPRILNGGELGTRFPFIEMMDEIWRVLKPNGVFYAITPAYPNPESFQDPTHVNIITDMTHLYFCEGKCFAKNYGFKGMFKAEKINWVYQRFHYKSKVSLKCKMKSIMYSLFMKRKTHLLWVLKAIK